MRSDEQGGAVYTMAAEEAFAGAEPPMPAAAPSIMDRMRERCIHLRQQKYADFNDEQWDYFLSVCIARRFDPMSNEICARLEPTARGALEVVIIVQIAALRRLASEHPTFGGADAPDYDHDDAPFPTRCVKKIHRMINGQKVTVEGVAYWDDFYPGPGSTWDEGYMYRLASCAEANGLRQAYGFAGLYVFEEMEKSRAPWRAPAASSAPPKDGEPVTHQQLMLKLIDMGFSERERKDIVRSFREAAPEDESEGFWAGIYRAVKSNPDTYRSGQAA